MPHSVTIPVIRRDDYTISLEQFDSYTFAHCSVNRWSHIVAAAIRRDLQRLLDLHGGPLHAVDPEDARKAKFIRMFGFRPIGDCRHLDGTSRTLYRKE